MIELNVYVISGIIAVLTCISLSIYVFKKDNKRRLNRIFSLQTFLMGIWCLFPVTTSLQLPMAIFFFVRLFYITAILNIPVFTQFCFEFLEVSDKRLEEGL